MRIRSLLVSLCGLNAQLAICGWAIDSSCNNDQQTLIRNAMTDVRTYATAALNAQRDATANPGGANRHLLDWLFGTQGNDNRAQEMAMSIENVFDGVNSILNGDNNGEIAAPNPDKLGNAHKDVKFYCDTSRLKRRSFPSMSWYDSDPLARFAVVGTSLFKPSDCVGAFAWTQTSAGFDQIQICPYYLQIAQSRAGQQIDTTSKRAKLALKFNFDQKVTDWLLTPIDLADLFTKVLLHELTHTRAGGQSLDLRTDGQHSTAVTNAAYGWKRCRTLSSVSTNPNTLQYGPQKNADTLALFGSVAAKIAQGSNVNEDGGFVITGPVQGGGG